MKSWTPLPFKVRMVLKTILFEILFVLNFFRLTLKIVLLNIIVQNISIYSIIWQKIAVNKYAI